MKKNLKVGLGLFATIGIVGVGVYFYRQFTLLRNVCVRAMQIDWQSTIAQVGSALISGSSLSNFSLPLDLEISNNSSTDLTIQKVDLTLYAEGVVMGSVTADFDQLIAKQTNSILNLNFNLTADSSNLGSILIEDVIGDVNYNVKGIITANASVFETIEIVYDSYFLSNGDNLDESQGTGCK